MNNSISQSGTTESDWFTGTHDSRGQFSTSEKQAHNNTKEAKIRWNPLTCLVFSLFIAVVSRSVLWKCNQGHAFTGLQWIQTNLSGIVAVKRRISLAPGRKREREIWGLSCTAGNLQSVNIWKKAQWARERGGGIEKHERLSAAREKDARTCNLKARPAPRRHARPLRSVTDPRTHVERSLTRLRTHDDSLKKWAVIRALRHPVSKISCNASLHK